MSTYAAKPGSIPYRVLAHLQTLARGAEVPTAQLATIVSAEANNFTAIMGPARAGGAVFARQKGGHPKSPLFWSLVDHTKVDAAAPKPPKLTAAALQPIVAEIPRTGRARLAPGTVDIDAVHRRHDNVIEMDAPQAGPAGDGSQKPDGDGAIRPARAGSDTHPQGANRDATGFEGNGREPRRYRLQSAEQSHDAVGSESPTGRGADGASALGAAPVSSSDEPAQFLPRSALRRPPAVRTNTEQRYRAEEAPRCAAITLTVEVASLHQAERVLQLVREMAGEGA